MYSLWVMKIACFTIHQSRSLNPPPPFFLRKKVSHQCPITITRGSAHFIVLPPGRELKLNDRTAVVRISSPGKICQPFCVLLCVCVCPPSCARNATFPLHQPRPGAVMNKSETHFINPLLVLIFFMHHHSKVCSSPFVHQCEA